MPRRAEIAFFIVLAGAAILLPAAAFALTPGTGTPGAGNNDVNAALTNENAFVGERSVVPINTDASSLGAVVGGPTMTVDPKGTKVHTRTERYSGETGKIQHGRDPSQVYVDPLQVVGDHGDNPAKTHVKEYKPTRRLQGTLTGQPVDRNHQDRPDVTGDSGSGPTGQPGSYNNTTWTPGKASQYYGDRIENGTGGSDDYYGRAHARWKMGDAAGARADAAQAYAMDPENGAALSLLKLTERQIAEPKLKASKPDFGLSSMEGQAGTPGGGGGPGAGTRPGDAGPAGGSEEGFGAYGGNPGDAAYGRGDSAAVARALNAARGQPPQEQSQALTRAAVAASRVKDRSAALALTAGALKLDPTNLEAYAVRSMVYLQAKDYAASAAEASKGLSLDPKSRPFLNRRALAYNRLGRYREGLADALSTLRLSAGDAMGYYNKSYAEAGLKDTKAAREDLQLAAELEPRFRKQYEAMLRLPDDSMLLDLYDAAAGEEGAAKAEEPVPVRKPLPLWPFAAAGAALLGFGILRGLTLRERTSVLNRRNAESEESAAGAPAAGPAETGPGTGFWSRYGLVRELGAGGMGLVYLAQDVRLDRLVAVKKMRDEIRGNRRERERFLKEAQTVAKLRHPGIVEIYSIEEDGDDAYLVFEYVAGRTLFDIIQEKGRLSLREALEFLRGVCCALEYAHGRNVIHRDLKPANIMVDADGAVKVMDFGIARQVSDALARQSMTNTVIGTPPYMAPEQEQGVVRRESDIYSLGVCLYEALSGELPFGGTPGAALLSKLEGKYIPVRKLVGDLPEAADRLIRRALAPDPEQRIKSAAEFLRELEEAAAA